MKKQILHIVVALSIVITLSVAGLAALNARVRATIPFDFMVNGKTLPAGAYTIQRDNFQEVILISGRENKVNVRAFTMNLTDKGSSSARLIFHRYGNQYFLSSIYDGDGNGLGLPRSKAERAAAREDKLVKSQSAPETITVAAVIAE